MKANSGVRKGDSSLIDSDREAKKQKLVSPPTPGRNFESLPKALQNQLNLFWKRESDLIKVIDPSKLDMFKNNAAPLARIKKIMRLNPKVCLIASEVPVLLAKACELFMKDLTMRTWTVTESRNRKTLGLGDLASACRQDEVFDFLIDFTSVLEGSDEKKTKTAAAATSTTTTTTTAAKTASMPSEEELFKLYMQQQKDGSGVGVALARPKTPPVPPPAKKRKRETE